MAGGHHVCPVLQRDIHTAPDRLSRNTRLMAEFLRVHVLRLRLWYTLRNGHCGAAINGWVSSFASYVCANKNQKYLTSIDQSKKMLSSRTDRFRAEPRSMLPWCTWLRFWIEKTFWKNVYSSRQLNCIHPSKLYHIILYFISTICLTFHDQCLLRPCKIIWTVRCYSLSLKKNIQLQVTNQTITGSDL